MYAYIIIGIIVVWIIGSLAIVRFIRNATKVKPPVEPAILIEESTGNIYHRHADGLYRLHYKGSNYPPGYKYHYLMGLGTFKHK